MSLLDYSSNLLIGSPSEKKLNLYILLIKMTVLTDSISEYATTLLCNDARETAAASSISKSFTDFTMGSFL